MDKNKEQVREFTSDALARIGAYMRTTLGLPEDMFIDKVNSMSSVEEQMGFIDFMYKKHPSIFKGMKHYVEQ